MRELLAFSSLQELDLGARGLELSNLLLYQ